MTEHPPTLEGHRNPGLRVFWESRGFGAGGAALGRIAAPLTPHEEVSTLPAAFRGTNFISEVIISQDGRWVYAANRLHDTVAIFVIGSTGSPNLVEEESTLGDYPHRVLHPGVVVRLLL